ncbi:pseudouridylate synthase TRUB2, mitochondrial [Patella vulgata]|uniref:pseudouridylate synthase TRUB2, mitochondrial n=1 Tax=Patella vulgata TaxID=6465 RepID=UPI0024A8B484|nr:pseudouridylate synthase TRUB2, mitochondrial [Patella vulgata]
MRFRWASDAYRRLNGVFCIYKPSELPISKVIEKIQWNLARDLNALPCYKYERLVDAPTEDNDDGSRSLLVTNQPVVTTLPDISDLSEHRLVLGPRYIGSDFEIWPVGPIPKHTSGVQVLGIGGGRQFLGFISRAMYLRVYHVKGRFGWATDNFSPKGRIIERTTFHHITKPKLDRMCSIAQANHTKLMFKYAGVHEDSQEAYEYACKGLVRPANKDMSPMLYGVKCIDYKLPDFTLEIHAINETSTYFKTLIHDIGLKLKSTAVCTDIRRLRYGHFTLDHALLQKHWALENILDNMRMCHKELHPDKLLIGANIDQIEKDKLLESEKHQKYLTSSVNK